MALLLHNDNENNTSYQNGDSTPKMDVVVQEVKKEFTLPEMLRTPSAWLMLWTTTILVGSGTYKTNNMGEMVESLGFSEALTPATLAIFSVAQAAARIVTGVSSEAALVGYHVPRPLFLLLASAISFVAHVMLAISTTSQVAFVMGCTVSGIAFGMAWPLMVLIVGDLFGIEHHGANYMFYDGYTKAIGTLLLSEYVAGTVYEAHVDKQEADGVTCLGPACFRQTHLTVAALSLTCIVTSLALQYTSRHVYTNITHKRK
jgi:MFS family permease